MMTPYTPPYMGYTTSICPLPLPEVIPLASEPSLPQNIQAYEPLTKLLQTLHEIPATLVKGALYKKDDYITRLFSNESWEEWSSNRSSLGKVVDLLVSRQLIDEATIKRANDEALKLLLAVPYRHYTPSCFVFLGATGMLSTYAWNPIPAAAGIAFCETTKTDFFYEDRS